MAYYFKMLLPQDFIIGQMQLASYAEREPYKCPVSGKDRVNTASI